MELLGIIIVGLLTGGMLSIYVLSIYMQDVFVIKDLTRLIHRTIIIITIHAVTVISVMRIYYKYENIVQVVSYSMVIILLSIAAVVDIKWKIIPNHLILVGSFLGSIMLFINTHITGINIIITIVLLGGLLWMISVFSKGALGMGDVKLVACIGIFLGLQKTLTVICMALVLSGIIAVFLLVFRYADKKKEMPFAPFILVATMITIL